MKPALLEKLFKRIVNKKCPICNETLPKEKVTINHLSLGDIEVCIRHMKDEIE